MSKPVIIYDFDGTVAQTLEAGVDIYNEIAEKNHYEKLLPEDFHEVREMGLRELVSKLRVPLFKVPWVAGLIRSGIKAKMPELETYPGMAEAFLGFARKGYRQGIITSNSEENVRAFLAHNDISEMEFVFSESSIFGKGKVIADFLANEKVDLAQAVYVGDELRDIEAAHANKLRVISVSWGANTRTALQSAEPEAIADSAEEFVAAVERILPVQAYSTV